MMRFFSTGQHAVTRFGLCSFCLLLALGAGLGACGQKGNLYLPEKAAPEQPAQPSDAER